MQNSSFSRIGMSSEGVPGVVVFEDGNDGIAFELEIDQV
jgi:hypothetical protein